MDADGAGSYFPFKVTFYPDVVCKWFRIAAMPPFDAFGLLTYCLIQPSYIIEPILM